MIPKKSRQEKLLGINFDTQVSLESHVSSLYKEGSQKMHVLERIIDYMDLEKRCLTHFMPLVSSSLKHQKTVQKTVFCCLQEVKKESGDMKWVNESFYNHSNWSLTVKLYVSQSNISRINKIRERSLRITYSDYHSSFADFLKKVTLYLAIIRI